MKRLVYKVSELKEKFYRHLNLRSKIKAMTVKHLENKLSVLRYGQHVGFVVDKAALEQVFSEYFGFPCQPFHRFLHYHNHPGLTQCRVDLASTPHYANLKKNLNCYTHL
jgi:hypothetical protein